MKKQGGRYKASALFWYVCRMSAQFAGFLTEIKFDATIIK